MHLSAAVSTNVILLAVVLAVAGGIIAGIFGIFLGALGIHKFILGFTGTGFLMLLVSVASCLFAAPVVGLIGLIEGIIYLTKTDEEFYQIYVVEKKAWF